MASFNILIKNQRNMYCKSLKLSEKYYTKHTKWFYQNQQMQRPSNYAFQNHAGTKMKYKVPKTWRKTFSLLRETWRSDKILRRKILTYASMMTFAFFFTTLGFMKFIQAFGPGGSGLSWRQEIWNEVGNKQANKTMEKIKEEGGLSYMNNIFGLGASPRMDTLEKRAQESLAKDKYKQWCDLWDRGFPKNPEEWKRASKLRPETITDWELMSPDWSGGPEHTPGGKINVESKKKSNKESNTESNT